MEKSKDEVQAVREQICQLKNHQKILLNKKSDAERKERTHRLIERGAILESVFPSVIPLSNEKVKAFLSDVSQLPEVRKLLKRSRKPGTRDNSIGYNGALIHPCGCRACCALPSAMGSYTPQTPCAPHRKAHPLRSMCLSVRPDIAIIGGELHGDLPLQH